MSRAPEGPGVGDGIMQELRLGNFWMRSPGVDSRAGVPTTRGALQTGGLDVLGSKYPNLRGKWIIRRGRSAWDPRAPGSETWAWLAGTFSGLVPRWVGWSPWLYASPPSGTREDTSLLWA